jgi:triosephosphate isomerase
MFQVFVNLKRFDVPKELGGVCPSEDPGDWIGDVIRRTRSLGLDGADDLNLTYLLPEALILPALDAAKGAGPHLALGCQGVYREDVAPGGNFGAFTSNLPAAAAVNLGCSWAMVGHSEERKDKLGVLQAAGLADSAQGLKSVDTLIGQEVGCAIKAGLKVLLCVGETADQRGVIRDVLDGQLSIGLEHARTQTDDVVIGYEPIWAIGPGKTPPQAEEIGQIATLVKEITTARFGVALPVVYGGGLKEENASGIAAEESVDGGLVALTRFTGEIGFDPDGLAGIIQKYREGVPV